MRKTSRSSKVTTTSEGSTKDELMQSVQTKLERMANQTNDDSFLPDDSEQLVELIKVELLNKKLIKEIISISDLSREEIKDIVSSYYQTQNMRMALRSQQRAIENSKKNNNSINATILNYMAKQFAIIEKSINDALTIIVSENTVGKWLLQINGIGPVIAAGCLSYFDVTGKSYASQFHSYAGLNDNNRPWIGRIGAQRIMDELLKDNPVIDNDFVTKYAAKTQWKYEYLRSSAYDEDTDTWSKTALVKAASKIPYNANLKVLCHKIGTSFSWLINKPKSKYGRLLAERKVLETQRNEEHAYAEQAARILETKRIDKSTVAYSAYIKGMLPKAHINARCERWVTKIFISHLFEEMYRVKYNKLPPAYYALVPEYMGNQHNKYIEPEVPFTPVPEDNA